jgi:hypothetical protein
MFLRIQEIQESYQRLGQLKYCGKSKMKPFFLSPTQVVRAAIHLNCKKKIQYTYVFQLIEAYGRDASINFLPTFLISKK